MTQQDYEDMALAGGVEIVSWNCHKENAYVKSETPTPISQHDVGYIRRWNPAESKADAFGLMVDAGISVEFPPDGSIEVWSPFQGNLKQRAAKLLPDEYSDKKAATIKAICDCATQIGRAKRGDDK